MKVLNSVLNVWAGRGAGGAWGFVRGFGEGWFLPRQALGCDQL